MSYDDEVIFVIPDDIGGSVVLMSEQTLMQARALLARQQTSKPALFASATAYAALGDRDEAFRLLLKLCSERDSLNYVKTDPRLASIHSDPRWQVLLRRMNLPPDDSVPSS